jgi:hypothetical protein
MSHLQQYALEACERYESAVSEISRLKLDILKQAPKSHFATIDGKGCEAGCYQCDVMAELLARRKDACKRRREAEKQICALGRASR